MILVLADDPPRWFPRQTRDDAALAPPAARRGMTVNQLVRDPPANMVDDSTDLPPQRKQVSA